MSSVKYYEVAFVFLVYIAMFQVDRLDLIKFLLKDLDTELIDFEELSVKTEGFVVQDIVDFCNKAVFEALKEGSKQFKLMLLFYNYNFYFRQQKRYR